MKEGGNNIRIIISGGGTGGHVFPAIAIADALRQKLKDPEILFVGAKGRMEMERVPAAGYEIVGLPVEGFRRKLSLTNLKVILKLLKSLRMAGRILRKFSPDAVVGVGGYASGPVLRKAAGMGIPTLIQEQNSYAGVTNRLLAGKAMKICVAYEGMEKYFPAEKLVIAGNPVRDEIRKLGGNVGQAQELVKEARKTFGIEPGAKVLLVLGGSLGARTINHSLRDGIGRILETDIRVIWQCGKYYHEEMKAALGPESAGKIILLDFISRMDQAYLSSDVIISRAGALTISELCHVGKPAILVPSPNVAEDHQTRNARALLEKSAALMIPDDKAGSDLVDEALALMNDDRRKKELSEQIASLAISDSAGRIAEEVIEMVNA